MTGNFNGMGKRILVVALFAFYVNSLAVRAATQPTTWTITVDIKGGDKPQYEVTYSPDADHGGCGYAKPGVDPYNLKICPTDSVIWQGASNGQKHDLVVFMSDHILTVKGNPTTTFKASDGNPTDTGTVSTSAIQGVGHEWYVAIYEKNGAKMHSDDPQIIIGTGSYEVPLLVNEIANQAQQLTLLLPGNREVKKLLKDSEALKKQLLIKK